MRISVAWIDPSSHAGHVRELDVPAGTTAGGALETAGVPADGMAVFGERCGAERILEEGDRVDAGFPLALTPMEARALRAARGRPARNAPVARHGGRHQLAKP